MRYEELGSGNQYAYPNHDVAPDKKTANWCMQYAKAAYYDFFSVYPKGVFANNGGDYEKFRMYALGKQSITQYKKLLGVDPQTDNTWLSCDWSVRAIISGYRDKAISRLMKEDYSIVCTPVDSLSKTELDKYYSGLRTKLIMKEILEQQNSELANHPLVQLQSNEPMDLEELEMRILNGEQFNRSMDAEMAIELGLYENDYRSCRRNLYENLFDHGVAGIKDWLGDDNKAKFRVCNNDNVVISFSKDATFKDIVHAGEQIDVSLIDLALVTDENGELMFNEKELQDFAGSIAGKWGNPGGLGQAYGFLRPIDKFKCKVLDLEFFTYNEYSYLDAYDENGNSDFRKAAYGRGKKSDKYKRKKIQYVYKCKWIVGTDKCYDWGMCYDQKRSVDVKKKAKTRLSYSFCAYNFYEMRAQGFMERLIPYIDDYQLTTLKIQNFKNRAVPSGWWINMDMLENVALNKGGANMTPREQLQMLFETGIIVGRSLDAAGNPMPGNIQPIIPIENSVMSELVGFFQDLQNTVMAIEKMTGYNDITSGNPNPKTLVPGYELANQSTNDALYPMAFAEETLSLRLAEEVLCRMQQGIRKGKIEGYVPYSGALGANTLMFVALDSGNLLRDMGIELQKRTTEQERNWIFSIVQVDIQNQLLNISDAIMIINTHNSKQAMSILAYRVKRAKEDAQKNQLQQIQLNNDGQQKSAQLAAQLTGQQKQIDYQHAQEMEKIIAQKEVAIAKMKIDSQERIALWQNEAKVQVADTTGQAKMLSSEIAGQHQQAKQHIANEKQEAVAV